MNCLTCQNLTRRKNHKYCSDRSQADFQYKKFIENWKSGLLNGNKGQQLPQLSNYPKRFLYEKFGEKCCLCDWNKRHPLTNEIPLEINHIDGNSLNNTESNLQVLCPNCTGFGSRAANKKQYG